MKARDFVPDGPLHTQPVGEHVVESDRRLALFDALRDVELGVYDEQKVKWIAGWDTGTAQAVVSWLERVRAAGFEAGMRRIIASVQARMAAEEQDLRRERGEPGE